MKKKILFGLGTLAIAVVLTFNVSIAKSSNSSYVDLSMISSTAIAQAENGPAPRVYWNGTCCQVSYNQATECAWSTCPA